MRRSTYRPSSDSDNCLDCPFADSFVAAERDAVAAAVCGSITYSSHLGVGEYSGRLALRHHYLLQQLPSRVQQG
jgi:hypothetical protein